MQTARLQAVGLLSQAIILASQADKLAPSSELLRPARAMPQAVWMSDLLYIFKPYENIIKHCLQGPNAILNVYFCILPHNFGQIQLVNQLRAAQSGLEPFLIG